MKLHLKKKCQLKNQSQNEKKKTNECGRKRVRKKERKAERRGEIERGKNITKPSRFPESQLSPWRRMWEKERNGETQIALFLLTIR